MLTVAPKDEVSSTSPDATTAAYKPRSDAASHDLFKVSELLNLLNGCLANEICCVLHASRKQGVGPRGLTGRLVDARLSDAQTHQDRADRIALRIVELGGELDFQERTVDCRRDVETDTGKSEGDMIRDALGAECLAFDGYQQLLHYLGRNDPGTRGLAEEILAAGVHHS